MVKRIARKHDDEFLNRPISRVTAGKLLNVTPARISQLERTGTIQAGSNGKFIPTKLVADYFRYIEQRKSSARIADDAVIRKLKIEAMERKAEQDAGEWVPMAKVKQWDLELAGKLHGDYTSLPARFTRDVKDRRRLQAMVDDIHTKFCKSIGRLGRETAKGKSP